MSCIICGGKTGLMSRSSPFGKVCSECEKYIPAHMHPEMSKERYLEIVEKNKKYSEVFSPTAQLGRLFIDSTHGLFLINSSEKAGYPISYGDTFSLRELKGISLYCSDVVNVYNKIHCSIKIRVETAMRAEDYTIVKSKACVSRIKGKYVEWQEPAELSMFRNLFIQMVDDNWNRCLKQISDIRRLADITE